MQVPSKGHTWMNTASQNDKSVSHIWAENSGQVFYSLTITTKNYRQTNKNTIPRTTQRV